MVSGAAGGYAAVLGFTVEEGQDGPVLRLPFADHLGGRPGFLHGGAVAGFLEIAATQMLSRVIGDPAVTATLVTCGVDYLRAGLPAEAFAATRVLRLGRRIAHLEARVWQEDRDRPIALARFNFLLRRGG